MSDNQIRLQIFGLFHRFEDGIGMRHGVLKIACVQAVGHSGAASDAVADFTNTRQFTVDPFHAKGAGPAIIPDQSRRDVTKLCRKILVNKKNVHRILLVCDPQCFSKLTLNSRQGPRETFQPRSRERGRENRVGFI
jgi:hypothetical protein